MKTKLRTVMLVLALGWGWLLPQCGQAFYNPSTGRWINRDPEQERGGPNLLASVGNDPLGHVDFLGRFSLPPKLCCPGARETSCNRVCAMACANKSTKDYLLAGGVVCYNGQVCPCVCGDPDDGWGLGLCPAMDEIILDHENQHAKKTWCHTCGLYAAGPEDLVVDFTQEECEQRRVTLERLSALLPSLPEGRCRDKASHFIRELSIWVSKNCH